MCSANRARLGLPGPCAPGQVTIGYSNFRTADGVIDTTIGHNQSADPLLVNPVPGAGQDFHIASASSPLIGAGTPDPSDGPSDRDGVAHPDPPAIGAYEYPVPPAAQPGTPPPGPAVPTANTRHERQANHLKARGDQLRVRGSAHVDAAARTHGGCLAQARNDLPRFGSTSRPPSRS